MFKSKLSLRNVILITICLATTTLFSCAPQATFIRSGQSFPPRADDDSVVIYHRAQDIPIDSERIGRVQLICAPMWTKSCDSITAFSLAKQRVNRAGGNALLITTFEQPSFWNQRQLTLRGDVFLVHDFSSPPDTVSNESRHWLYAGLGFGPEVGVSFMLPHFRYYNFQNRGNFYTYFGVGAHLNIMMGVFFCSLSLSYGIQRSIFTFDTSIGAWWRPRIRPYNEDSPVSGPYFHSTLNPKVGLRFRNVWLKAGPSIHLYRNYRRSVDDFIPGRIGNRYFNFEILWTW